MPRKIGFSVVSWSSHEDNFSAKELMVHAPTVNGWRSSRLCTYPQYITLQLVEKYRIKRLQLLADQYLIPAKVEFHIGDILPDTSSPVLTRQLHRLGYVSLSDNESIDFKARELKSVHVDAVGQYLRITFHRNHVNRHNIYNQVALVAINIVGDSLDGNAFNTIPSREQLIEHYLNSTQLEAALDTTLMGKFESISPLDDLAFDMYQDPEVAQIIRELDQKKQNMVRHEIYEQAKVLKQAIADLQKVGERLARYDVEKRCAIEKEDYDLAKKKKNQMEAYRRTVYQQLEVHNLLDLAMITKVEDALPACNPLSSSPSSGHPSVPVKSHDTLKRGKKSNTRRLQSRTDIVLPKLSKQVVTPCTSSAAPHIGVNSMPFDDRPLPVLQRKDTTVDVSPEMVQYPQPYAQRSPHSPEMSEEAQPLTEKAQREAAHSIEVYGESLIALAYSKTWSHRRNALLEVYKKLLDASSTTPKEEMRNMIRAAIFLVKKALLDKVSSVFQTSLKLLRLMLSQLIPGLCLGRAEMSHCLEQTWHNLLFRTGDSASRLRLAAIAFIQEIATLKDVRTLQVIPGELVKPFKCNYPSRLAQSRAELLEKLLHVLGTENTGFTLDNVMMFCIAALEHSAPAVRELAVHIIFSMYKQDRSAVLSHLSPQNTASRNTFLYKTVFDGFAKIDGKLLENQTLKKCNSKEDGQKEKEEIHCLQEQLAALKEITEKEDETNKQQCTNKAAPKVEKETQKTGKSVTKLPQTKLKQTEDTQQSITYLDNLCIFCGKKDESFTEDGLDIHYWKHCPMLRRCDECRQVVEIASLTEHLLGECDSSSNFSLCQLCSEAVATEDLNHHIRGLACNPPISGKACNHCPLCHSNFKPGEEAWKAHLMGREGCKQNSRRAAVCQRTQPAQGRAAGGAKFKQAWSVGARARPMGRGSRIPSLSPLIRGQTPGNQ